MPLVDTTIKWVQLMLSPRPNYYEVKRAFEKHFNGVIPYKGQGYKVFKRWEYRVINHLDSEGYVDWNFGEFREDALRRDHRHAFRRRVHRCVRRVL